jgi:Carboxypeptidase regulatory-like domain
MKMRSSFIGFGVATLAVTVLAAQNQQDVRIVTGGGVNLSGTIDGLPGVAGGAANTPMPLGTGVVFGQVTEADSNRPVGGALVTLTIPGAQPLRVMADAQGRFGFRDLPKGRFSINTTRPGWVDGSYGRTRPGGQPLALALADGEKVSGVNVPMWRFASVSGAVSDEFGDPVVNLPVRVLKRALQNGKVRLTPLSQDSTDDRGIYRIGMLEPGDYIVAIPMQQGMSIDIPFEAAGRDVMVTRAVAVAGAGGGGSMMMVSADTATGSAGTTEDGRPLSYPTVFYPNAASASKATVISVTSGEEKAAVDFQLKAVPTVKVSGTAMGPEGPTANLQLTLIPGEAEDLVSSVETIAGFTDGQGRFTINNVPPGQYRLRAIRSARAGAEETQTFGGGGMVVVTRTLVNNGTAPLPTAPTLWAEMTVAVGTRDISDLTVGLRPGLKVNGIVQFNGAAERPANDRLSTIGITLTPADALPGQIMGRGRAEASGQFTTVGLAPGRYLINVQGGFPGWTFHSAMVNGRDASIYPIDLESGDISGVVIAFTDRPSELSGDVVADGAALEAMTVLVFPSEQREWTGPGAGSRRFQSARADKAGKYRLTNLPAGEYLAVAIPDKKAADWQNPRFLETLLADATRVRVRDGDSVTQNLKVSR